MEDCFDEVKFEISESNQQQYVKSFILHWNTVNMQFDNYTIDSTQAAENCPPQTTSKPS